MRKALLFFVVLVLSAVCYGSIAFAAENKTGIVTASSLRLRSGPSLSDTIVGGIKKGQTVDLLLYTNGWYKVKTSAGKIAWASGTYLKPATTSVARSTSPTNPVLASTLISEAKKYLGVPYVWGGSTTKGFDCSGFVSYVFKKYGVTLPRVSRDQAQKGILVSKANLMPGDLIFFDTDGGKNQVNHVGMYIGNGNFIHASSGKDMVIISSLGNEFYSNAYMHSRRVI